MKIAWVSNHSGQPTGYGVIADHVPPYIQANSRHKLAEVAVSGIARVQPFERKGITVYGTSGYNGKIGVGDWPGIQRKINADLWMLNFDVWALGNALDRMGLGYAIYPPIDHDPLPPVWNSALRNAIDIVPYCQFGARVIREGMGITASISQPIPHGVDTKIFHPVDVSKAEVFGQDIPEDTFIVGIFKNNQGSRVKYDVQMEGFRIFLSEIGGKGAKLYIHANSRGNTAVDIKQLVGQLNLAGHVYLVSPERYAFGLSVEELAKTYNACDVVLNAVSGEGWGLPISEAFACGKPVIGTAYSSMPELILGVEGAIDKTRLDVGECIDAPRGWLVPVSDKEYTIGKQSYRRTFRAEDVAAALLAAYNVGKEGRVEKGEQARKWVQATDWEKVGSQWIDYFDALEDKVKPKTYTWKPIENKGVGKQKMAVVVYSFNRADYLVKTLDSLAKNTKIDEADVYLYQDGWRNEVEYPYTDAPGETVNKERVQKCIEIMNGFPFKHKEIVTHEDNRCIGRQLESAKDRLFEDYEYVIFLDDDHIVSSNYIETLLNLHEQFPDAIVGAQATEDKNIPRDAKIDEVCITRKQTPDRVARAGRWRWLAYLMPKSVYLATNDLMKEYMEFIGPSYRNIPHQAVMIKYGVTISGFDGVLDKFCDDLGIERIATVVPRGKYIGESGLFGTPQLYRVMGFSANRRIDFDTVDKFRVRMKYE